MCLVLFASWLLGRHGDLKAAYSGFSAEEFVLEVNRPEVLEGDYPSGAGLFRSSSFMWLYVLADDPTAAYYIEPDRVEELVRPAFRRIDVSQGGDYEASELKPIHTLERR